MKKTIAMITAAALVFTLAGCNNTENNSTGSTGANTPASVSSAAQGTDESSDVPAVPDSTPGGESNDIPADPDNSIVVPDDPDNPADPNGGEGGVNNSGIEFPDNRAGRMVKAALASGEWGALMQIEEDALSISIGVDAADLDEFCCVMPMLSAVPNEVYCFKPKSGKEDAVKTVLSNLVDAKKEDHMLYPMVQDAWANAVIGEDDGYVYLVVHPDNAREAADIMGATK